MVTLKRITITTTTTIPIIVIRVIRDAIEAVHLTTRRDNTIMKRHIGTTMELVVAVLDHSSNIMAMAHL
ncbi:hypothetical protein D3C80_1621020 [compost metagenome]